MMMSKTHFIKNIDSIIFACLILYTLTFLLDIKINFLTTACVFGIIKLFFIKPNIKIRSKHLYFIAVFIVCIFLSVIFNDIAINFSEYKSRFISPLLGILIMFLYKFTKEKIIILLSGFSVSLLFNAIVVIYQFSQGGTGRLVGFASNYMLLCGVNVLILPIICAVAIYNSDINLKYRLLFVTTILINVPAVIFENTRIVWIALFITYSLILVCSLKKKKDIYIYIILFILILGVIFYISPESTNRLSTIADTTAQTQSNYQRILMWKSALQMFWDYPLLGIGIGNYHDVIMNSYLTEEFRDIPYHPHNTFLYILAEAGVVGAISYILLFIYLYYNCITNWFKEKNVISLGYLACLLAYSINCLTDAMFCGYNIKMTTHIFWLFTSMYLILSKQVIVDYQKMKIK